MPIDLGEFPAFAGSEAGPAAGRIISGFGEAISGLGETLGRRAQRYSQTQQAFLNLQTAKEVIMAKDIYYTSINEFNKQLDINPDYETQGEAWDKYNASVYERIQEVLTLETSKVEFAKWYVPEKDKQTDYVYTEIRKKTIAAGQATVRLALQDAAESGNEEALYEIGKTAVRGGILSGEQAMSLAKELLPQARYNKIYRQLEMLEDPDVAVALLLTPGAGEQTGLSPAQLEDMIGDFLYKSDTIQKLAEKINERDGKIAWEEYLRKDSEDSFESLTERESYVFKVDKAHQEIVRQEVEQWKKLYGAAPEQRITLTQDVLANHLIAQAWDWARNAAKDTEAPFSAERLGDYIVSQEGKPPRLRTEQLSVIRNALADATKAREEGEISKTVSALYSRLYNAVDTNRNPALEVRISEIDRELANGNLTNEQHQAVLAKRHELQRSFEEGLGRTSEEVEMEAASIIFDGSILMMQKQQWLERNRKKFSGDDYTKWQARIEVSSGKQSRADIFSALNFYYNEAIRQEVNDNRRRELALQRYDAQIAMEQYMVQNPNNEKAWQDKLHEFQGKQALKDLTEALKKEIAPARFPTTLPGPGRARELETARERGLLRQFPERAAEFETIYRAEALKQEQAAIEKLKIQVKSHAQNMLGDEEYLAADGKRYVVRQTDVTGVIRERVYQVLYREDPKDRTKKQFRYELVPGQK